MYSCVAEPCSYPADSVAIRLLVIGTELETAGAGGFGVQWCPERWMIWCECYLWWLLLLLFYPLSQK